MTLYILYTLGAIGVSLVGLVWVVTRPEPDVYLKSPETLADIRKGRLR